MIFNKDSRLLSEDLSENTVHGVITDPPYGMNLMNLGWDKTLPPVDIWKECFRVLRPGGFCLAFGHTRIYHRLACQLEDSGFVIKDCLCWGYASGFPHSYNVSKAIDDKAGAERKVVAKRVHPTLKNAPQVKSNAFHADTLVSHESMESWDITEPATDDAKKWDGWGTQLKPAWEPIVVAQKPLEGSYVENILKYKVGAMNIDECRIPYASDDDRKALESFVNFEGKDRGDARYFSANVGGKKQVNVHPNGRWPANLLWLDPVFADYDRFFMIPKPATSEKGEYNEHDTVKPVRLMERLISLFTPKPSVIGEDVIVLDPFMGSGTTGVACKSLARKFYGYEISTDSFDTARRRLTERKVSHFDMFDR